MKIIGWTYWDNPKYEEMFPYGVKWNLEERHTVDSVIAKELRDKGYKFTGDYHQNGLYGVPIFDNGKVFQCSQRYWGGIMVDAYPEEIDDSDGYGYCMWAWMPPKEMILPDENDYI